MVCTDFDELIESIAAGEMVPDAEAQEHLASCVACAHALELARQIGAYARERDRLLRRGCAPESHRSGI